MMEARDIACCLRAIRTGSRSFHAASMLLPQKVRERSLVLYAFCRLADDSVDLTEAKSRAVDVLSERLDLAYAGTPAQHPVDRAFSAMISDIDLPRALPEALLEGLAWDAAARRYQTFDDLQAYCARVASSVGVMMCVSMGVRDRHVLARACDLGVAMQLTNIARDVGEDALAGRLYLPLDWLDAQDVVPEAFLAAPVPTPAIRETVARMLQEADMLYARSVAGIPGLPVKCRTGILAARHIYARIGTHIHRASCDSVTRRARTSSVEKAALLARASGEAAFRSLMPNAPNLTAAPLPATEFLVDAAAEDAPISAWGDGRTGTILSVLAQLEQQDRGPRLA